MLRGVEGHFLSQAEPATILRISSRTLALALALGLEAGVVSIGRYRGAGAVRVRLSCCAMRAFR